jgi:hypothetical protein
MAFQLPDSEDSFRLLKDRLSSRQARLQECQSQHGAKEGIAQRKTVFQDEQLRAESGWPTWVARLAMEVCVDQL